MARVHRWERWKRPSERAPARPRAERRVRTPLPPAPSVQPSFEARLLGDVTVLVSAGASALPTSDQFEALAMHGSVVTGSRETKHRFRRGTLVVIHSAAKREVLLLTVPELRAMRGTLRRSP